MKIPYKRLRSLDLMKIDGVYISTTRIRFLNRQPTSCGPGQLVISQELSDESVHCVQGQAGVLNCEIPQWFDNEFLAAAFDLLLPLAGTFVQGKSGNRPKLRMTSLSNAGSTGIFTIVVAKINREITLA
jgi:hypothetical protein